MDYRQAIHLQNTLENNSFIKYFKETIFVNALIQISKFSKKSRIRETKHLSTDADSSTDAIGGWTKNTPKPDFFEKRKKSFKLQKLKNI